MTSYRAPDEPTDDRLDRLEASVRAGRVERVMSMLKTGLNALFILAGFSGLVLAAAYLVERAAAAEAVRAELATTATEEARSHCAEACESHGLTIENVRTDGARAVSCACADEAQRVVLWNDLAQPRLTLEEQAYARCEDACKHKGYAMMHAMVVCAQRSDGQLIESCQQYRTDTCYCHGMDEPLWNDRP